MEDLSSRKWIEAERCYSNDFDSLISKIKEACHIQGLVFQEIGKIDGMPIPIIVPNGSSASPNILVAGCFHGDEPAGSWAILKFLQNLPEGARKLNLSFLPVVNPTGFLRSTRTNRWGEDPNRGFDHTASGHPETSREGMILLEHLTLIETLGKEIFISLHEDWELTKYYIYTFENSNDVGPFSRALGSAEAKYFDPYPDGPLEGGIVKNGIIFKFCDGSFEDMLFHRGVSMTACTETPGKLDLDIRIEANTHIVAETVRFAASYSNLDI